MGFCKSEYYQHLEVHSFVSSGQLFCIHIILTMASKGNTSVTVKPVYTASSKDFPIKNY